MLLNLISHLLGLLLIPIVTFTLADAHEQHQIHGAVKGSNVLLLTYMRGGSSVVGEMFNQNPEAFYWFEPIDGFYSHLYGTQHGFFPMDIYYNKDETVRSDNPFPTSGSLYNLPMNAFPGNLYIAADFWLSPIARASLPIYIERQCKGPCRYPICYR